jgi:hypothetical protein
MRYAKLSPEHLATEVNRLDFPAPAIAVVVPIAEARAARKVDRNLDTGVSESPQLLEKTSNT